jgi:hypothetical protein
MLVTQVAREFGGQAQSFQIRRPNNGFERHRRSLREVRGAAAVTAPAVNSNRMVGCFPC